MDSNRKPTFDARDENFGYVCHRCLKCCHNKRIQLNPYEVARLARHCGLTTSAFRAAWTEDGAGLILGQTANGACVFLGSAGCTVHPDRPLACRLYPLGRHVRGNGAESFCHIEPHPQSYGEFTRTGTIREFLAAQAAGDFIQAADAYFLWLCAAHDGLHDASERDAATSCPEDTDLSSSLACDLLDMDNAIAVYCTATGVAEPADMEARKELHLAILYQHLEKATGVRHERPETNPSK